MPPAIKAQDSVQHNFSLNGYITNMQSFTFQRFNSDWTSDNLLHNRLNFNWHNTANNLSAAFEMRNRLLSGESVEQVPGYTEMIGADDGFLDLSFNLASGNSYVLNTKIDRAYIDYTREKFQVRVGRQRINWGQCFVWNPNDLFNAYSYFDFDYIEKPGSDAVRVQYYRSSTSTIELAVKADSANKITSAALFRFNRWNYDIQFIAGMYREQDFVLGTGWSGNIIDASFRGEISYFFPKQNSADETGTLVMSVGSEYTFKNTFTLQFEALYNQMQRDSVTSGFKDYYIMNLSPKSLSFTELNFLLQGSYPVTPLFNASLAVMYFPKENGYFLGPTLSYSLTDNLEFSLITQSFFGHPVKGITDYLNAAYLRLKWNF
jgi:hypothetical protein